MRKSHPMEVDVQNSHFEVQKTIIISYYRVMFRVHHRKIHSVCLIQYYDPLGDLCSGLLSDPKKDCT